MGRFLARGFIAEIGELTRIDLDIWPINSEGVPASVRTELVRENANLLLSVPNANEDRLDVFVLMSDLNGDASIVIRAGLPRDIAHRADSVNQLTFFFLLVQGAGLAFLMMVPLNRAIRGPLSILSKHLRAIRRTNDVFIRVGTSGGD